MDSRGVKKAHAGPLCVYLRRVSIVNGLLTKAEELSQHDGILSIVSLLLFKAPRRASNMQNTANASLLVIRRELKYRAGSIRVQLYCPSPRRRTSKGQRYNIPQVEEETLCQGGERNFAARPTVIDRSSSVSSAV